MSRETETKEILGHLLEGAIVTRYAKAGVYEKDQATQVEGVLTLRVGKLEYAIEIQARPKGAEADRAAAVLLESKHWKEDDGA